MMVEHAKPSLPIIPAKVGGNPITLPEKKSEIKAEISVNETLKKT